MEATEEVAAHARPRPQILQTKRGRADEYTHALDSSPRRLPEILRTRAPPGLKSKIKNYLVLEDGDEQHDGEPGEHAQVLQDKVSQLAALVVLAVPVEHFRQL